MIKNNLYKTIKNHNQQAAMFGIDARITMLIIAIFGLIGSAVLYAVVSKAKSEAIIASVKNIDTAIENYIDDTSSIPSTIDELYDTLPTKSSQSNKWEGPYLEGEKTNTLVPQLSWTKESDNCNSTTSSHRYCSYTLDLVFSNVSDAVCGKIKDYYSNDPAILYDSGTKKLTISYARSKSGTYKRVKYKVTETP